MTLTRRIVWAFGRRILIAQLLLLIVAGLVVSLSVRWDFDDPTTGAYFALSEIERQIDADASGRLVIKDPDALAAIRAEHPQFWYVVRGPDGLVREGPVPETALTILASLTSDAAGNLAWTAKTPGGPFVLGTIGGFQVLVGGFPTDLADVIRYVGVVFASYVGFILLVSTMATMLAVATAPRLVRSLFQSLRPIAERNWNEEGSLDTAELPDELKAFGDSFNKALGRLSTISTQLDRAAMEIAHELKGPLTSLQMRLATLPSSPQKSDLVVEVRAMESLVAALLAIARDVGQADVHDDVDLHALVRDLCLDRAPLAIRNNRTLVFLDEEGTTPVRTNPSLISIVVGNVLDNALRHTRPGDTITVSLPAPEAVRISDTGPGLPPGLKASGPQPFLRSGASPGSGLGMVIATSIMNRLGGRIEFADSETGGACVTIRLG
jgi:signal transduction histidine kinase